MGESDMTSWGWGVIRVRRQRGFYRDRLAAYRVRIDGDRAGKLDEGEAEDFFVSPGEHRVRITIDRYWTSQEVTLEIRAGELAEFVCRPGWSTIASLVFAWVRPHRYIRLDGPTVTWSMA